MSLDLFGPASAPGAVTSRPGDGRSFTTTDTFFKDCSSPDLDDGTEFQAAWFNQTLAVLRALARGNGQTGGSTDIVTQDNADDAILLKAAQHLIQRGQPNYAVATGTANALVVSLTPALAEYKDGAIIRVKIAYKNTGPATINAGLGFIPIIRSDGVTPLQPGDLLPGMGAEFMLIGGNAQMLTRLPRVKLSGNLTLYISTAGSDTTGDGSAGNPWRTRQFAWYTAQAIYDLAYTYTLTFQMADGTYTDPFVAGGVFVGATSPASIIFQGNMTTPASCAIVTSGAAWGGAQGAQYRIQGFTVTGQDGVLALTYSNISIGNSMVFGACVQAHISSNIGGTISIDGSYTVTGGSQNHYLAGVSSYIYLSVANGVTLVGTPAFSTAFATALEGSNINIPSPMASFSGAASGSRYAVYSNGVINTTGGGASFFPGSTAGSFSTGGQYF